MLARIGRNVIIVINVKIAHTFVKTAGNYVRTAIPMISVWAAIPVRIVTVVLPARTVGKHVLNVKRRNSVGDVINARAVPLFVRDAEKNATNAMTAGAVAAIPVRIVMKVRPVRAVARPVLIAKQRNSVMNVIPVKTVLLSVRDAEKNAGTVMVAGASGVIPAATVTGIRPVRAAARPALNVKRKSSAMTVITVRTVLRSANLAESTVSNVQMTAGAVAVIPVRTVMANLSVRSAGKPVFCARVRSSAMNAIPVRIVP